MLSTQIQQLVKLAESKGIRVKAASSTFMDNLQVGAMGYYFDRHRTIYIRKGMSVKDAEETITHEICHAIWDLTKAHKTEYLKKKIDLGFFKKLSIFFKYPPCGWEEEMFCYSLENKPSQVYQLLKQL